jgi:hypothetical protein
VCSSLLHSKVAYFYARVCVCVCVCVCERERERDWVSFSMYTTVIHDEVHVSGQPNEHIMTNILRKLMVPYGDILRMDGLGETGVARVLFGLSSR